MNLTLPTVDVSSAKSDLADLGPRAKAAISDIELPTLNLSRVPDLDGKGRQVAGSLSEAGQSVTGALADAGKAVGGALGDAGHAMSGALSAAGDRLKDLRPTPEPKRRSIAPIAIGGAVVGAIALAVGTAAAFLMDPIQGARRRAAVKRRADGVAARLREMRSNQMETKLLEAPDTEVVAVPIDVSETPDVSSELEFTDEAVPVTPAAAKTRGHNGASHSAASVAEAAGE